MAVNATAVWRVRPSGSNTNGGGYDPGIGGAATDYSRQNAAQASGTLGATSGAGSTTFTDATAAAFTSVMIGNCIQITAGTNFQTGFYFVTAFTNANSVVLDRTPTSGGAGSAGVWKLGGGWADFWTNTTSSGPLVPGNIVYILGSGMPNPAAYAYDYDASATSFTPATGDAVSGNITYANDPATPGYKAPPDTTGGMPTIKVRGLLFYNSTGVVNNLGFKGLYFIGGSSTNASFGILSVAQPSYGWIANGCVLDQFAFDIGFTNLSLGLQNLDVTGCEIFSSVAPGSPGTNYAIYHGVGNTVTGNNIHDTVGFGVLASHGMSISNNIIAKCRQDGVTLVAASQYSSVTVHNNTIDGNLGSGITLADQATVAYASIFNNIISNHVTGGTSGIAALAGSTAANDQVKGFVDYNVFYNNTTDVSSISYGPHDTHGGSNPYVAQSTENYTLA